MRAAEGETNAVGSRSREPGHASGGEGPRHRRPTTASPHPQPTCPRRLPSLTHAPHYSPAHPLHPLTRLTSAASLSLSVRSGSRLSSVCLAARHPSSCRTTPGSAWPTSSRRASRQRQKRGSDSRGPRESCGGGRVERWGMGWEGGVRVGGGEGRMGDGEARWGWARRFGLCGLRVGGGGVVGCGGGSGADGGCWERGAGGGRWERGGWEGSDCMDVMFRKVICWCCC